MVFQDLLEGCGPLWQSLRGVEEDTFGSPAEQIGVGSCSGTHEHGAECENFIPPTL